MKKRSSFRNSQFYSNRKNIIKLQAEIEDLKKIRIYQKDDLSKLDAITVPVGVELVEKFAYRKYLVKKPRKRYKYTPKPGPDETWQLEVAIAVIAASLPATVKAIGEIKTGYGSEKTRRIVRIFDGLHWSIRKTSQPETTLVECR